MVDSRLHGIEEDVRFDHGVADELISAFKAAAESIGTQTGARAAAVSTAKVDFSGHFSELFTSNADIGAADGVEVATRLREVAVAATRLKEEAKKEQQRREVAREWMRERAARHELVKWGYDTVQALIGHIEQPPVGPPAEPVTLTVSAPPVARRQIPSPGGVIVTGTGGGVSSARPANLRSFADTWATLNTELMPLPMSLQGHLDSFASHCRWGTLEADDTIMGFRNWNSENSGQVGWARVIAEAFEAAGSEGEIASVADAALYQALNNAGMNATRRDLTIAPAQVVGAPPTSGYAVDPVNTATGNFVETEVDLDFQGGCGNLAIYRTYSSRGLVSGVYGTGWGSILDMELRFDADGAIWVMPDGRHQPFPRDGEAWGKADGDSLWLNFGELPAAFGRRNGYLIRGNNGGWWAFDQSGCWLGLGWGNGTGIYVSRDENGNVTRLTHERGRWVDIAYRDNRVTALHASDGRHVEYDYDQSGRLQSVRRNGEQRKYVWNEEGLISAVYDGAGHRELLNTYDADGRVKKQITNLGREVNFSYLPHRITVVSDPDGGRSNSWIADERGRIIGIIDANGAKQSMSYDSSGNLILSRDRKGRLTVHQYDDRGRNILSKGPDGLIVEKEWDIEDRLISVTNSHGARVRYEYTDESPFPLKIVDPEGGITQLEWDKGLLSRLIDPTGVTVSFTHDQYGDLESVTNAAGDTIRFIRDQVGRVIEQIDPLGGHTRFSYDPNGRLLSRQEPDGSLWRWEWDDNFGPARFIDPLGNVTSVQRGPDGQIVSTTDPLGRVITRSFDDFGNLAGLELPGGIQWAFSHDALGRLRELHDPNGGTWTNEYMPDGMLLSTVDPTGVRRVFGYTEQDHSLGPKNATQNAQSGFSISLNDGVKVQTTYFDDLGRPRQFEASDGSAEVVVRDLCGRIVEAVNADGGLEQWKRDAAGRVVEHIDATGALTRYEYDKCGRRSAEIAPGGERITFEWDEMSRLRAKTSSTGIYEKAERDKLGRIVRYVISGRGVWKIKYDPCGRVISTSDPVFGRRRYSYDSAGQLVKVINALGGETCYSYDDLGRATRIVDPLGGVILREYDAFNHVVSNIDQLGRKTTARYDAAGRQVWQQDPDGRITEWTYGKDGLPEATSLDGQLISRLSRNYIAREVVLEDYTHSAVDPLVHTLKFDPSGRLIERLRNDSGLKWTYDEEGRRLTMTDPFGRVTHYSWDQSGNLARIQSPDCASEYSYDSEGRLLTSRVGDRQQKWTLNNGLPSRHEVTSGNGSLTESTFIERDDSGRVIALRSDDAVTTFSYDEAGQLLSSRHTLSNGIRHERQWEWDKAGRMCAQIVNGARTEFQYDPAGQLIEMVGPDSTKRYQYDPCGRRVFSRTKTGGHSAETHIEWDALGHLKSITDEHNQRYDVRIDALGELIGIGAGETQSPNVWWDSASQIPTIATLGKEEFHTGPGLTQAYAGQLGPTAWRQSRVTDAGDPWAVAEGPWNLDAPSSLTSSGAITIAGLEIMGARVYDPSTASFLSTDPIEAPLGSVWAFNPYSYAGNDPVGASDPWGLAAVSDADLAKYTNVKGLVQMGQDWFANNWEYVAGGLMIVGGIALLCTGVGGPAGLALLGGSGALISGGVSMGVQKFQNGRVDPGQLGLDMAIGGIAGLAGGGTGLFLGARHASPLFTSVSAGSVDGGISGLLTYAASPGPHDPLGALRSTLTGAGIGGLTGGAAHGIGSKIPSGSGSGSQHVIESVTPPSAMRPLAELSPAPRPVPDGQYFPRIPLRRNQHGVNLPDTKSDISDLIPGGHTYPWPVRPGYDLGVDGAHTQLGWRIGEHKDMTYEYGQAREYNELGEPMRDIDFTDHCRPDLHPNPHWHHQLPNSTGGTKNREKIARPLDY